MKVHIDPTWRIRWMDVGGGCDAALCYLYGSSLLTLTSKLTLMYGVGRAFDRPARRGHVDVYGLGVHIDATWRIRWIDALYLTVCPGRAVDRRARHCQDGDDQELHVQVQSRGTAVQEPQLLLCHHPHALPGLEFCTLPSCPATYCIFWDYWHCPHSMQSRVLWNGTVSIRVSVPFAHCCSGFCCYWARRVGPVAPQQHGAAARRTAAHVGSATFTAHVFSWTQTCFTPTVYCLLLFWWISCIGLLVNCAKYWDVLWLVTLYVTVCTGGVCEQRAENWFILSMLW